jgi:hypothetical protein
MFDPTRIYTKPAIGRTIGRSTRCLDLWRERGLLPDPDVLLGGKQPAWWGRTLNESPAFAPATPTTPEAA